VEDLLAVALEALPKEGTIGAPSGVS
jgi:hypothetical protein